MEKRWVLKKKPDIEVVEQLSKQLNINKILKKQLLKIVDAYIRPAYNSFKSPEHIKRFTKIVLEIDANEENELFFVPSYDYAGGVDAPEGIIDIVGGGGFWDEAIWEDFYYDTQVISTAYGYLQVF